MNTLIKNATVLLPDGTTPVANIAVTDDRIAAVGDVPENFQADKVIDGTQHLQFPDLSTRIHTRP